jgi:hypothetical protein
MEEKVKENKNKTTLIEIVYNDAYKWVENFQQTQNTDTWGLSNLDIEFEII